MKQHIINIIPEISATLFIMLILYLYSIHSKIDRFKEKETEEPVFLKSDLFIVKGVDNHLSVPIYYVSTTHNELSFELLSTQVWAKGHTLTFIKFRE